MNTSTLTGLRFQNLQIPQGATVQNVYVEFTADESDSGASNFTFQGEDVDSAAALTSTDFDLSSRVKTTASVTWNSVPSWSTGSKYQSPDLTSIVQEIVNRAGWSSGNDLVMVVSSTGTRVAESREGSSSNAALLHVELIATTVSRGELWYL
jgi:hypothetical protein